MTEESYATAPVYPMCHDEYTLIEVPLRVQNTNRAIEMVNGIPHIEKVVNGEQKFLECRFRGPMSHPAHGDKQATNHVLLRVRRKKNDKRQYKFEVMGKIVNCITFQGMVDFQYLQGEKFDASKTSLQESNQPTTTLTTTTSALNSTSSSITTTTTTETRLTSSTTSSSSTTATGGRVAPPPPDQIDIQSKLHAIDQEAEEHQRRKQVTDYVYAQDRAPVEEPSSSSSSSSTTGRRNTSIPVMGSSTAPTPSTQFQQLTMEEQNAVRASHQEQQSASMDASSNSGGSSGSGSSDVTSTGSGTSTSGRRREKLDLTPPIFSRFDLPMDYEFRANPLSTMVTVTRDDGTTIFKRQLKQSGAKRPPICQLSFGDPIPTGPDPNLGPAPFQEDDERESLMSAIRQLFERRPIWSRRALQAQFESKKMKLHIKFVLPHVAYYYKDGPWRKLWVKYGVDPKNDKSMGIYQMLDFRVPAEFRTQVLQRRKEKGLLSENEEFGGVDLLRRAPKRRQAVHEDLRSIMFSSQSTPSKSQTQTVDLNASEVHHDESQINDMDDDDLEANTKNMFSNQESYLFTSIPGQKSTVYQLCDIRLRSVLEIIRVQDHRKQIEVDDAELNEEKAKMKRKHNERYKFGSRMIKLRNAVCHDKYGWYTLDALEQIRYLMKRKIEQWIEKGNEDDDEDIVLDSDDEEDVDGTGGDFDDFDFDAPARISGSSSSSSSSHRHAAASSSSASSSSDPSSPSSNLLIPPIIPVIANNKQGGGGGGDPMSDDEEEDDVTLDAPSDLLIGNSQR